MIVAQVGQEKPASPADELRWSISLARITSLSARALSNPGEMIHDVINLAYGRDFLNETKKYDVVVVHSVYHSNLLREENRLVFIGSVPNESVISPFHSVEQWKARLVETGAAYIVVHESQMFSLSGWQLGELEGYEISFRDHRVTLYHRLPRAVKAKGKVA